QQPAARLGDAPEVGEERPGIVEVLDDVAADDPVERLVNQRDDLARVAAVDVIDPFLGDGGGVAVDLDADHTALLALLERGAEGSLAAAELEDGFGVGGDA